MFRFFSKKKIQQQELKPQQIKEDFSNIADIAEYFKDLSGITFDKQLSVLHIRVKSFCNFRKIHSFSELLKLVKENKILRQELIDHLTTNETFFYREFTQIQKLTRLIKLENKPITILTAPCASGQESYSIAIALLEENINNFSILGIDINKEAINQAKIASYTKRDIGNLSDKLLKRYFIKKDDRYLLNEKVKQFTNFEVANIFDKDFASLGKFDYIFCRNMLIYFDKNTKKRAISILKSMLKDKSKDIFFGHADLIGLEE